MRADPDLAPWLPTGTVTFLFTDIEGSAKLWEADNCEHLPDSCARLSGIVVAAMPGRHDPGDEPRSPRH